MGVVTVYTKSTVTALAHTNTVQDCCPSISRNADGRVELADSPSNMRVDVLEIGECSNETSW